MHDIPPTRRRLLITTYHYDGAYSMESRLSYQRAQCAAREYDVTVISARPEVSAPSCDSRREGARPVELHILSTNRLERALMKAPGSYYLGYRLWHRRVFKLAQRLHADRPFDLVHQVSFCGYREPSYGWRLGVPFVWGPVGGTQSFPWRFMSQLSVGAAAREVARNVVNAGQLRLDRRVRRAARAAASLMAANQAVAGDLRRSLGVTPLVQLETGVESNRPVVTRWRREDPSLRILWAGRLQPWKGLPLLLRAIAALPAGCQVQLRVMGEGPCLASWQRLARRLGIGDRIQWIGWPTYAEQLPHYDWADVFAFTSLRDTSGTGLLEALAAGAPIIGLQHQGAADIMTDGCAIQVNADRPSTAIAGFRDAIARLTADCELLETLRQGAVERSYHFDWQRQWEATRLVYESALARAEPACRTFNLPTCPATVRSVARVLEASL